MDGWNGMGWMDLWTLLREEHHFTVLIMPSGMEAAPPEAISGDQEGIYLRLQAESLAKNGLLLLQSDNKLE